MLARMQRSWHGGVMTARASVAAAWPRKQPYAIAARNWRGIVRSAARNWRGIVRSAARNWRGIVRSAARNWRGIAMRRRA
jgi:hypothetical protein